MSTDVEPISEQPAGQSPNGVAVLDRVRAALADAQAAGRPEPTQRVLAAELGVTRHQVRKAQDVIAAETAAQVGDQPDQPATTGHPPGDPGEPAGTQHRPPHQWPLILIGVAAAVAVWGGWVDLGQMTGFGVIHLLPGLPGWLGDLQINTAITLPIGIEAYGAYALRVWLSSATLSERTRTYACVSAWASLGVGAGAQVASHLMRAAEVTSAPWGVTLAVACVPVGVLGVATGLATLVRKDRRPGGGGR